MDFQPFVDPEFKIMTSNHLAYLLLAANQFENIVPLNHLKFNSFGTLMQSKCHANSFANYLKSNIINPIILELSF